MKKHLLLIGYGAWGKRSLQDILEYYKQKNFRVTILDQTEEAFEDIENKVTDNKIRAKMAGYPIRWHSVGLNFESLMEPFVDAHLPAPSETICYLAIPPEHYIEAIQRYSLFAKTFALEKPLARDIDGLEKLRSFIEERWDLEFRAVDHYLFKEVLMVLRGYAAGESELADPFTRRVEKSVRWSITLTEENLDSSERMKIINEGIITDMLPHVCVIIELLLQAAYVGAASAGVKIKHKYTFAELVNNEYLTVSWCSRHRAAEMNNQAYEERGINPNAETASYIRLTLTVPGLHRKDIYVLIGKGIKSPEPIKQIRFGPFRSEAIIDLSSGRIVLGDTELRVDMPNRSLPSQLMSDEGWPIGIETATAAVSLIDKVKKECSQQELLMYSNQRLERPADRFCQWAMDGQADEVDQSLRGFIFDLGGVLANLDNIKRELQAFMSANFIEGSDEEHQMEQVESAYLDNSYAACKIAHQTFQEVYNEKLLSLIHEQLENLMEHELHIGAKEILNFASRHGILVGVISRYPEEVLDIILEALDLKQLCLIARSSLHNGSEWNIVSTCDGIITELGLNPCQCIFFDNDADNLRLISEAPGTSQVRVIGVGENLSKEFLTRDAWKNLGRTLTDMEVNQAMINANEFVKAIGVVAATNS